MTDADVIIVGAGPAGSTAARRLATNDIQVILLDKERFPRSKPCAGGIRFKVTELLDFEITEVIHRKISGLALISPSGLRVDAIPEDRSKPGFMVMRDEFDSLLLSRAKDAGAEIREEFKVEQVRQDANEVQVVGPEGKVLTAKYLIGADGINSVVAKNLGFYEGWRGQDACVAIEIEARLAPEEIHRACADTTGYDADLFFLYFGAVQYGYTWCFPKREHLSLGICCRQDLAKNLRQVFDEWYSRFIHEMNIQPEIFAESSARFPIKAVRHPVKGRTVLVGDAAGFVDAFTGEGIPYAIESGILAAEAISEAITENNPKKIRRYHALCKKTILADLKISESMANMFYKKMDNMETLCRFFHEDSYAAYLIAASIAGLLPMKTVKTKLTLRMMRTRPRDALSLL